jgi:hypothetical protein
MDKMRIQPLTAFADIYIINEKMILNVVCIGISSLIFKSSGYKLILIDFDMLGHFEYLLIAVVKSKSQINDDA